MVKLSEFIGELLSDMAEARKYADSASVKLSQSYHADPFLKGMPVPHYTFDEAEISFPLMVSGLILDDIPEKKLEQLLLSAIRLKLPGILLEDFRKSYITRKSQEEKKKTREKQAGISVDQEEKRNFKAGSKAAPPAPAAQGQIDNSLIQRYSQSSVKIAASLQKPMERFLKTANFEVVKLLDIKDALAEELKRAVTDEFRSYQEDQKPYTTDENLTSFVQAVGIDMFFEFQQEINIDKGIAVNPETGKINEYSIKENLLFIKLKVKEQDLDFVVEGDSNGGTSRYLSLT